MVACRVGWVIMTPFSYVRAVPAPRDISLVPQHGRFPCLSGRIGWMKVPREFGQTMRCLMKSHVTDPAIGRQPWLTRELCALGG